MSVKKMGSKLAQGVRQVKAQQVSTPAAVKPAARPAASVAPRAAAKGNSSGTLHPSRVWPD